MDDRELRASLRRLPEARPGEAFTAEVLARVERDERRRAAAGGVAAGRAGAGPRWRATLLAAGLAVALVAAAALWSPGGGWWRGSGGKGEDVAQVGTDHSTSRSRQAVEAELGESATSAEGEGERPDEESRGRRGDGDEGDGMSGSPSSGGPVSPQQLALHQTPLAEGVSAETASDGPALHDPLASAPAVAAELPPTVSPGADFFAAPPSDLPAAERLARLREERERLERRLAAFRSELPPAEPPVVLLGADEGFDLVFDLGRWAAAPPAGSAPGAARPAVHSAGQPPRRF